jgi:hypothetical protein
MTMMCAFERRRPAAPRRSGSWRLQALITIAVLCSGLSAAAAALPAPPVNEAVDAAPSTAAPTFRPPIFGDDTLSYVVGSSYRNPHTVSASQPDGADIVRNSIEFKHVDGWKYGNNAIEIVMKKSNDVEPAAGGGTGALGLYAVLRSGIGLNRVMGRPVVAVGPLRDISFEVGTNLETKSSAYAPQERSLFVGPVLQFRFGAAFLNVGFHLRKEWNHNGNYGVSESYDPDLNVEPVWHFPFRVGRVQLAFDGFADYNTAKGKDGGGRETAAEFITRPVLKVDVGSLVKGRARLLEAGVGIEYWHNMFGKDADKVPGAKQCTAVFLLTVHLPMGGAR